MYSKDFQSSSYGCLRTLQHSFVGRTFICAASRNICNEWQRWTQDSVPVQTLDTTGSEEASKWSRVVVCAKDFVIQGSRETDGKFYLDCRPHDPSLPYCFLFIRFLNDCYLSGIVRPSLLSVWSPVWWRWFRTLNLFFQGDNCKVTDVRWKNLLFDVHLLAKLCFASYPTWGDSLVR